MKDIQISATEFKKHFLSLVNDVKEKNHSFIITKRKLPIAKITPLDDSISSNQKSFFGIMQGSVKINDDIVNHSFESEWKSNDE